MFDVSRFGNRLGYSSLPVRDRRVEYLEHLCSTKEWLDGPYDGEAQDEEDSALLLMGWLVARARSTSTAKAKAKAKVKVQSELRIVIPPQVQTGVIKRWGSTKSSISASANCGSSISSEYSSFDKMSVEPPPDPEEDGEELTVEKLARLVSPVKLGFPRSVAQEMLLRVFEREWEGLAESW